MKFLVIFLIPLAIQAASIKNSKKFEPRSTQTLNINLSANQSATINSDNWPNGNYTKATSYRWIVSAPSGLIVQIQFKAQPFGVEANTQVSDGCFDFVQFMDGSWSSTGVCSNQNPMYRRVCGKNAPTEIFYSPNNQVIIEFCSDYADQDKGFGLTVTAGMMTTTTAKPTGGPSGNCGVQASRFQPIDVDSRIVGGEHANPHSWPWAAALFTGSDGFSYQFCGGSLINEGWVMTAGHCFFGETDMTQFHVKLGADNKGSGYQSNEANQQVLEIDRAFVHPSFDPDALNHDITLLKLKKKVTINDYVKPVCLPTNADNLAAGTSTVIVGWGTTAEGGQDSPTLMQVVIPIYDHKKCQAEYTSMGYNVDDTMICAGLQQGGKDSCQGDSGGPLMIKKNDGAWYIEGIVSWGKGCAESNFAGVYSRVSSLIDWANGIIKANGMPNN